MDQLCSCRSNMPERRLQLWNTVHVRYETED
uniref:Uncharacterized protein n=1 Tax=Solanum lycopersicum TaxID=4081 RepID=A0A3Q7FVA9_SOLLC